MKRRVVVLSKTTTNRKAKNRFVHFTDPFSDNRKETDMEADFKKIIKPSQMRKKLDWDKMNPEWVSSLEEANVWWYKDEIPDGINELEKAGMEEAFLLREHLLEFGGNIACMQLFDPDLKDIMERGQFWYGEHARVKKGRPCHCHENSSLLWDANRGHCQIATGYALSKDGCWRQHTWVVQPLATKYRIWETTEKRIAYFGYVLNDEECEKFLFENT